MLVKFTVDGGASGPRAEQQAREDMFKTYLSYLRSFDNTAEQTGASVNSKISRQKHGCHCGVDSVYKSGRG
jgi:hypothetical protein